MKSFLAILGLYMVSALYAILLLIGMRLFLHVRYVAASAMMPEFEINDRVLVESISNYLNRPFRYGEVILFYPPPSEMGGEELHSDFLSVMGRLTGLPFLPYEPAFLKRVIGVPGDRVRIESGRGVFVNDKLLDESAYIRKPANYDLVVLGDIGGRSVSGQTLIPYSGDLARQPIIVPPGQLFVLGDNRNNSEDSHVFGMLDQRRVIGRVQMVLWPRLKTIGIPSG